MVPDDAIVENPDCVRWTPDERWRGDDENSDDEDADVLKAISESLRVERLLTGAVNGCRM